MDNADMDRQPIKRSYFSRQRELNNVVPYRDLSDEPCSSLHSQKMEYEATKFTDCCELFFVLKTKASKV